MKLNNLIKTAIKVAPIVYPIIKKMIDSKKAGNTTTPTRRK